MPRARCALAMTLLLQEGRYGIGGRTEASAPTGALLVVRRGGALPLPRATARVAPTEGYKECGKRIPPSRRCRDSSPCAGEPFLYRKNDRPETVVFY